MPAETSLRERRRQATLAEIKQAAVRQLADAGPDGLSLRAVAREVGVTVQALYHYVDSRDALVTALVADAHDALADAVGAAADAQAGAAAAERLVAVGLAYRRWALDNRGRFLLIYGVPLPDYRAPEDGPTTVAAARLGAAMREVVFGPWSAEELARVAPPPDAEQDLLARLVEVDRRLALRLPPGATAAFLAGWAQLHGLVMLELLNHLPWLGDDAPGLYRVVLRERSEGFERLRHP